MQQARGPCRLLCGPGSVNRRQQLVGRQPRNEAVLLQDGADRCVAVYEESRRRIRIAPTGGGPRVDHLHRPGDVLMFVGDHRQVRAVSLCQPRGGLVIVRDDKNADLSSSKIFVPFFELTQLDLADPSPPAAKK